MEVDQDTPNEAYDDEYEETEMEEADEEEEYNLRMFGINQALPVDGAPDWESGEICNSTTFVANCWQ